MPPPPPPPPPPPAPPLAPPPPPGLPPEVALDPKRNVLMEGIRASGGKRALKSVPRREKKVSDFMDILKAEAKSANKVNSSSKSN